MLAAEAAGCYYPQIGNDNQCCSENSHYYNHAISNQVPESQQTSLSYLSYSCLPPGSACEWSPPAGEALLLANMEAKWLGAESPQQLLQVCCVGKCNEPKMDGSVWCADHARLKIALP